MEQIENGKASIRTDWEAAPEDRYTDSHGDGLRASGSAGGMDTGLRPVGHVGTDCSLRTGRVPDLPAPELNERFTSAPDDRSIYDRNFRYVRLSIEGEFANAVALTNYVKALVAALNRQLG